MVYVYLICFKMSSGCVPIIVIADILRPIYFQLKLLIGFIYNYLVSHFVHSTICASFPNSVIHKISCKGTTFFTDMQIFAYFFKLVAFFVSFLKNMHTFPKIR